MQTGKEQSKSKKTITEKLGQVSDAHKSKHLRQFSTQSYLGQFVCHPGLHRARAPAIILLKTKKLLAPLGSSVAVIPWSPGKTFEYMGRAFAYR
jgi:hypothetical protein